MLFHFIIIYPSSLPSRYLVSYVHSKKMLNPLIAKAKPICTSCLSSTACTCNQYSQQFRFDKIEKWNVRLDFIKRNHVRRFHVRTGWSEPTVGGSERNCNTRNSCKSVTSWIIKCIGWWKRKYCAICWWNVAGQWGAIGRNNWLSPFYQLFWSSRLGK